MRALPRKTLSGLAACLLAFAATGALAQHGRRADGAAGIRILSATYGGNCNAGLSGNATGHVARACDGRTACAYRVDHGAIGDPAMFCPKTFVVSYRCGNGPETEARLAAEASGQTVSLACGGSDMAGGARTGTGRSAPATMAVKIGNRTGYTLATRFYGRGSGAEWPAQGSHHIRNGATMSFSLPCTVGERVCVGAQALEDDEEEWGVGLSGDLDEPGACWTCVHGGKELRYWFQETE